MLRLTIDNALRFRASDVPKRVLEEVVSSFRYRNPDVWKLRNIGKSVRGVPPHLLTHKYLKRKDSVEVARGGFRKLTRIFSQNDIPYKLIDNRLTLPSVDFPIAPTPRGYQVTPIKRMTDREQTLGVGVCGCGKTIMLLSAIAAVRQPTLVIVWHGGLQKQWITEASKFLGLDRSQIGGVGGVFRKPVVSPFLNIAMQQSLYRPDKLALFVDKIGFLGVDEVHKFAARTFREVIHSFPARWRVGVTEDVRRSDSKEFLIYDSFGRPSWKLDDDDFGKEHVLPMKIVFVATDFDYEDEEAKIDPTGLITELVGDPKRNRLIWTCALKELRAGRPSIIFTDRVDHAEMFKRLADKFGIPAGLLIGGKDEKKDSESTKERLESGDLMLGIGTSYCDHGLNIPRLSRAFITCATGRAPRRKTPKRFGQQVGRIRRPYPGKEDAVAYYFWDRKVETLRTALHRIRSRFPDIEIVNPELDW